MDDGLLIVERLMEAGVEENQAKGIAKEFIGAADKGDISKSEERLGNRIGGVEERIGEVEERLEGRIGEVEERLEGRIGEVEERLEGRIDGLEKRLEKRIDGLEGKIDTGNSRVFWAIVLIGVGLLLERLIMGILGLGG